ncbi:MAG TPA: carboxypeptidase-like regulatory domain-containing protein [Bryobacteraceae bacterium]|nr:carboxypeptidase-like regulatory domain-containing protein [Bryobacteraceae bacterium]
MTPSRIRQFVAGILFLPLVILGQEAEKPGSIAGAVLNSVTGEGVRSASVSLRGKPAAGQVINSSQSPLQTVTTNAEGRFEFQNVTPGLYFIFTQKSGFIPDRRSTQSSKATVVGPGQAVTGVELKLTPQAIVAGRVLNADGEPVQGAFVAALRKSYAGGKRRWMPVGNSQTNDLGEYRLINLEPGSILVRANPPAQMAPAGTSRPSQQGAPAGEARPVATYYPGVLEASEAAHLDARAGETASNIDIQLQHATGFTVKGRITDPEASAESRYLISAARTDEIAFGSSAMTQANPDGSFEIRGLVPGSYLLRTMVAGRGSPDMQFRQGLAQVEVTANVEGVAIQITGPVKLGGVVAIENVPPGQKVDISQIYVVFTAAEFGTGGMRYPPVVKQDGTWSTDGVTPGSYRVSAMMRSFDGPTAYVSAVTAAGQDILGKYIDITAGGPGPINITLSMDSSTITGKLESGLEPSARTGQLTAVSIPASERFRGVDQLQSVVVGEDGTFTLKGVRPGEHLVFVFNNYEYGALSDPDFLKKVESKAVKVKTNAGETATAQLKVSEWPEGMAVQ